MDTLQLPTKPRTLASHAAGARPPSRDDEPGLAFDASIGGGDFEALRRAYRPHGGFAGSEEISRRLRHVCDQPLSILARAIVSRSMLTVSWRGETLAPVFQFELADMSVRPACTRVFDELVRVYDNRELALWFAAPNAWLDGAAPVALLASDELAVLQAARADRFVARG